LTEVEIEPRALALPVVSVAMVGCGAFAGLSDAVAVALIVVGAGMFFIGMILPTLTEFQIGVKGFSGKLRERDQEFKATLDPDSERLMSAAIDRAGNAEVGEELLKQALVDTYMRWRQAKRDGAAEAVLGQLEELARSTGQTARPKAGDVR